YHGIGTVANPYPVFNATEYRAMRDISPWGQGYLPSELDGITNGTNTNWQKEMFQNSMRAEHNLNVTGGSNSNTYSLGGTYYKETSLLPGEDFTRYNVRATIDTRIGSRIKVGINSLNSVSINNGSQFVSGSSMFRNISLTPLTSPYNADGTINLFPAGNIDDLNGSDRYSPLLLKSGVPNRWVDRVRRLRTVNNLYGELEISKGLRYRVNLGLNYAQQQAAQFRGSDQPGNPSYFRPNQGNIARVSNGETWGYTLENLIFYDKTIGKHKINFTGLYSIQENQSFDNFTQKDSITEDFVQWYNLGLSTPINGSNTSVGGGESSWALISYMARVNYSFDDKYLLTLTGRIDGSSRLAKGNNYFTYPAVSAGWNIDNEDFFKNVRNVNTLRLRLGWGKTSNQAINPYASLGNVSNNNGLAAGNTGGNIIRYNFGPTILTGYNLVNLPNPNLRWEFTNTVNLGIDFGFFKNRITGSIEYYNAKTSDVLYGINLPVTSGVAGNFQTNIGEIENKGFEFSISTINYTSKSGFTWSTDLNLFFNRNKILKLSNNISRDIGNQLHVGYPLSAIWDYNKLGIWQISEAAQAAQYGARPGQIKLMDYGGGPDGKPDGILNTADQHIIGDGDARLQGGMTQRITFKNFDFSTVFYARFGGTLISQIHQPNAAFLTIMDGRRNSLKVDYWTPTNPTNWFPMPQSQIVTPSTSTAWTTLGYYDASFVKIRSINFGYTVSSAALKKLKIQNARFYCTLDNVGVLFSPYFKQTGIDPEGTGLGNQGVSNPGNIRGGANGAVTIGLATPQRRTLTFGANITL
ncbi:MAG: TonB-dependent receptor, partial [Chitinophagaceae bacterium]|nr:TonB-dependent receptor [Chitinophagaceae bacterium]